MKKFLLTNLAVIAATASAISPFTLKNVEFEGISENQASSLQDLLKLHAGDRVDDKKVADAIRTLYATGNFNNIDIQRTPGDNLKVTLDPKKVIATVNFKGNSLLPTDQIRKSYEDANVRTGARLNSDTIDNLNEAIENFYKSQGFNQVEVSTQYQAREDGTVDVTVYINESKKAYLKELRIVGNKAFTQSQLIKNSKLHPNTSFFNFYHNSNFNAEGEKELLKSISDYYLNRGYARYKLVGTTEEKLNPQRPQDVTWTVNISEGDVYKVSGVDFFTRDDDLLAEFKRRDFVKTDDIYRQAQVDYTIDAIKNYLATLGYARPEVKPVLSFDDANKTVKVTFAINKGNKYKVNLISFEGNHLTKDEVIRRQLLQQENAVYNLNQVEYDVATMQRTGFFQDVSHEIRPVQGTPDQVDLVYKFREAPNGSFQIGLGYGDSQGVTFTAKLTQSNFLGTGRTVSVEAEKSAGRLSASLDFTEPYITKSGIALNTSVFYSSVDTEKLKNYNGAVYRNETFGASLGTAIPLSRYQTLRPSISFRQSHTYNLGKEYTRYTYLKSIGQEPKTDSDVWEVTTRNLEFGLTYNFNNFDRYLFPTKGTDITISGTITKPLSTDAYWTATASFRNYLPLDSQGKFVFSTRFRAAHAAGIGDKQLPLSALYSVGGYTSIRGFNSGAFGPASIQCSVDSTGAHKQYSAENAAAGNCSPSFGNTLGGDTMVHGGFDLIFPLFFGEAARSVRTYGFFDYGAAWHTKWNDIVKDFPGKETWANDKVKYPRYEDYSKPNFRASVGIGLDWQSPLGLLSFAVSKPVIKKDYDRSETFSINFGTNF